MRPAAVCCRKKVAGRAWLPNNGQGAAALVALRWPWYRLSPLLGAFLLLVTSAPARAVGGFFIVMQAGGDMPLSSRASGPTEARVCYVTSLSPIFAGRDATRCKL
jgi:hypothetical protein